MQDTKPLEVWIDPVIDTLDVEETNLFPNRGADGSRYPDCTRS